MSLSKSKVVGMAGDNAQLAAALAAFCKYAKWRKITVLFSKTDGGYYGSIAQVMKTTASKFGVIVEFTTFDCTSSLEVEKSVEFAQSSSRGIVNSE